MAPLLLLIQLTQKEEAWRSMGVVSTVAGLLCYALSSSFNDLFGEWKSSTIILYTAFSFIIFILVVFAKDWQQLRILRFFAKKWENSRILRFGPPHSTFWVMISTTVFSFFSDRAAKGKPDAYSVISSVAFATTSLSLSRHVPFVFVELMYFFMGVLIAQMMKIRVLLGGFVGIGLSYCLMVLHAYLDATPECRGIQHQPQVVIEVASLQSSASGVSAQNQANALDSASTRGSEGVGVGLSGNTVEATNTEGLTERGGNRRPDNSRNQRDSRKQYQLDLDKIISGEDTRTSLMIKNIPNKYTSRMLLAAIDENHRGTYDFLYLPIDFKNKFNVGYAFINMVSPSHIIPFYKAFNGKKWEKFNSEEVASLAYTRIQGKVALVTHFQVKKA